MVQIGRGQALLRVQERNRWGAKEPLVEVAGVEISPNVLHVDLDAPNRMRPINEHLIYTFCPANLDQFLDRDEDARHRGNVVDDGQPDLPAIGLPELQRLPEFVNDLFVGGHREGQGDLDHMAASAGDVGLDGLLHGAEGIVEHDHGVALVEIALSEGPGDVLEYDGRGGGGVVHEGDLVDVVGVDEVFDEGAGSEEGGLEAVEVEVVGLAEEETLPSELGGKDGGGAAAEAAIVNAGDGGVVVGELVADLGSGDGGRRWPRPFWDGPVSVVAVAAPVLSTVVAVRIHREGFRVSGWWN